MADLQSFTVAEGTAVTLSSPDTVITAKVYDGDPPALVADFTGADAIHFPRDWAALSADQRATIMADLAPRIVQMRAGVA